MAFITQTGTTNTISVKATSHTNIGSFTLRVLQVTAKGADQTFDALDLTIHCVLASVTAPTAPDLATRTYTIYAPTKTIDMSSVAFATHTQSPDCGYTLTPSYSWTLPSGTIPISTSGAVLSVQSTIQSQASAGYSVTFKVTFSENTSNGGSANTLPQVLVTFDIVVNNPCVTATFDAFSPALSSMNVAQGATATQEFTDVTDSVGNQYSNKYICGPRTYVMYNNA